jgi:hypothetical protein
MSWWRPASDLSQRQLRIIDSAVDRVGNTPSGACIWVQGCAGAGKTLVLVHIARRLADKTAQLFHDFRGFRLSANHGCRDARYGRNLGRDGSPRVDQGAQFAFRNAIDYFARRDFDNAGAIVRAEAGRLEIEDNKTAKKMPPQDHRGLCSEYRRLDALIW